MRMGLASDERSLWLGQHVLPHEPALRMWLSARRVDGLEIDDIVQEAYARLVEVEDYRHIHDPKCYLFQIASSVIADYLRRQKIIPIKSFPDLDCLNQLSAAPSPERQIIDREEICRLAEAIASMPAKVREVFILRRVRGLSQREVAFQMGISESTVEKHMSRGFIVVFDFFRNSGNPPPRPSMGWPEKKGSDRLRAKEKRQSDRYRGG